MVIYIDAVLADLFSALCQATTRGSAIGLLSPPLPKDERVKADKLPERDSVVTTRKSSVIARRRFEQPARAAGSRTSWPTSSGAAWRRNRRVDGLLGARRCGHGIESSAVRTGTTEPPTSMRVGLSSPAM